MSVSGEHDVDVVVAGGGPVGLSTAVLLGRLGVRVLLAERRPTTCTHPKATVLNTRTMELFRLWGIEDEVRERGLPIDHSTAISWVTALDGYEIGQLDLLEGGAKLDEWLDQSPTLPAICPQDVVEPILRRSASAYPSVDVRFATELVDFTDVGDGVTVTLAPPGGARQRVRARWLVAADGPQSPVRRRLNIGVTGTGPLGRLVNIYFHADLGRWVQRCPSVLYWIVNPRLHGVIHSLDGAERWLLNAFVDPTADASAPYDADHCAELVRAAVGAPQLDVDIRSIKPWTMAASMAERYRVGNVVLAGDCAHEFPPTGGFGLNTGVQDAHNLAWKLAATVGGWAAPALVDSYEEERAPVVRMNAEQTVRNARNIMDMLFQRVPNPAELVEDGARGDARRAELAAAIPEQREHFDFQGEALGAIYRSAAVLPDGSQPPAVANPITDYAPSAHPGARAPHAWVRVGGEERSTIDLFDGRFVLLAGPDGDHWPQDADAAADALGVPLRALRLEHELEPVEPTAAVLELYGMARDGAVLIRPDGHVAWRTRSAGAARPGALREALQRVLAGESHETSEGAIHEQRDDTPAGAGLAAGA